MMEGGRARVVLLAHGALHLVKSVRDHTTVHGSRSVLNAWSTEETRQEQSVVDMVRAHEIGSKVHKA